MSLGLKYRNIETERESSKIYEVIKNKATINSEYKIRKYYVNDHNTLFKEIRIVPYKDVIPKEWLFKTERRKRALSEVEFADGLIKTLRKYIKKVWSQKKHHAVFHSSGWDSRIISTIIRKLYEELGDRWLGEIKFVCFGSECKIVKTILEAEGWKDDIPLILPLDTSYYVSNLDFQRAWKYVNGYAPYPVNNFYWSVNELTKRHLIPENPSKTQVWAASYFNELIKVTSPQKTVMIDPFLRKYYYSTYSHFVSALSHDVIQPILNHDTLRFVLEAKTTFHENPRILVVKRLDRKLADVLPCPPSTRPPIPRFYLKKIREDYENSWYGTNILQSPKFTGKLLYSDWWSAWSAASFIEHLIKQGVHVLV